MEANQKSDAHTRHSLGETAIKLEQDIAFLNTKISLLKKQTKPNSVMLKTFELMLEKRELALEQIARKNLNIKTGT